MKLFTYLDGADARVGVVLNNHRQGIDIIKIESQRAGSYPEFYKSMQEIIESGDLALKEIAGTVVYAEQYIDSIDTLNLDDIHYLPPLINPVKLLCFSVYEKHMKQSVDALVNAKFGKLGTALNKVFKLIKVPKSFYLKPTYYKGNTTSFIGNKGKVVWPSFAENMMDYELEMALVVGKKGKDIPAQEAHKYIWGYTIFNDFSARERLIEEVMKGKVGPLKSKDFDTGNALGPWIVTADEIDNPQNLAMKVRVNGEVKGEANTSEMSFSIPALIQTASEGEYIIPGEIIATGAAGDGTGIESWSFLNPGDHIQLEIDQIGVLDNQLVKNC